VPSKDETSETTYWIFSVFLLIVPCNFNLIYILTKSLNISINQKQKKNFNSFYFSTFRSSLKSHPLWVTLQGMAVLFGYVKLLNLTIKKIVSSNFNRLSLVVNLSTVYFGWFCLFVLFIFKFCVYISRSTAAFHYQGSIQGWAPCQRDEYSS